MQLLPGKENRRTPISMQIKKNLPVIYSYMREYSNETEEKDRKVIQIEHLPVYQTLGVLMTGPQKPISKLL